jgi:predicted RNA-binding protein with TRAM domain
MAFGKGKGFGLPKPVKVGDELTVTIEAIASKGDGIAKVKGFVVFVKGAKQGDNLKVRITDVKPRFATAEIIQ